MTAIELTEARVIAAYDALATGDPATIEEYWDPEVTWLAAGKSRVSGLHVGLSEFLGFMKTMGEVTGGSLQVEPRGLLVGTDIAVLLTHNTATRADDPTRRMDIDEVHYLRWRDGKIVEGKGALFGDGTAEFSQFVG
jgi:uncharacterized protein